MDTRYTFRRSARLLSSRDFKAVFASALKKSGDARIVMLARANGRQVSRLGIIVAKRHVRRAVDRNRLKRVVRESFRLSPVRSQGLDLIVLVRAGIGAMSRSTLRATLERHWHKLIEGPRRC